MSKINADPRLPIVKDEKIRPLTQRLYELFRQYATAHNKSYMWDTEGTAAPTTGTWAISQMCKNTSPTSGVTLIGWVCISSGTPGTWADITVSGWRERLLSDRTYYVRTDGSNSNTGLTNSSGGAFLTIQKAFDVLATIDGNGFNAIIQVADGTYTGTVITKQYIGLAQVTIQGNASTPTNVVLTSSGTTVSHENPSFSLAIKDVSVSSTGSTSILSSNNAVIKINNINLGSTAGGGQQLYAYNGGRIAVEGNYSISGGSGVHIIIYTGGIVHGNSKTITLTGTPNFSVSFIYMGACGTSQMHGFTYSGSATGKRYEVLTNSVCSTNGGGANYFPGNVAGTTDGFGVYV